MCPIYAVLAAPLARPLGTKVFLWYAHWNRTRMLEAAVRASNLVLSVDAALRPRDVGQGRRHRPRHRRLRLHLRSGPARARRSELSALGRYSAAKGLDPIIRAVARVRSEGLDVELRTHGTASSAAEAATLDELRALVAELGVAESVELGGPIPRTEIPALLVASHALVNNMRPGAPGQGRLRGRRGVPAGDRLESALRRAARRPRAAAALSHWTTSTVSQRAIAAVGSLDSDARGAIGTTLRERVLARHSVDSWADAVVRLCVGGSPSAER